MEVGTELSVQIKKAIKAKLQEMQCYVDDELPDYIMVMIANKKTTDQMTEDLKIFLSEGSVDFCKWLATVLERLDKVGKETEKENDSKKEREDKKVSKKQSPPRSRSTSRNKTSKASSPKRSRKSRSPDRSEKQRSEKRPKSRENDRSRPQPGSRRTVVDSSGDSHGKNVFREDSRRTKHRETDRERGTANSNRKRSISRDLDDRKKSEVVSKRESARKKRKSSGSRSPEPSRVEIPEYKKTGTTVMIKNEYNEEGVKSGFAMNSLRDASPLSSEESEAFGRKTSNASKEKTSDRIVSPIHKVEQKVVAKIPPLMSVVETDHRITSPLKLSARERLGVRRTLEPKKTGIVKPLVVSNTENASNDLRQRLGERQGLRARIVNKDHATEFSRLNTIFSKALQDVTTVDISSRSRTVEEYDPLQPDIRKAQKAAARLPKVTVQNENAEVEILRLAARKTQRKKEKAKRHRSESNRSSDQIESQSDSEAVKKPSRSSRKRRASITHRERKYSSDEEELKATKFVVSLKGAAKFIDQVRTLGKNEESGSEVGDSEDEKATDNEKGEESTQESETDDSPKKNVSLKRKPAAHASVRNLRSPQETESLKEAQEISLERCKFWPNCKLGSQCTYVHPSKPCMKFPQCSFGDKCLFLHPQCRYGASCLNATCGFTHPTTRSALPQQNLLHVIKPPAPKPAPTKPAEVLCKFGTQCKTPGCHFMHPKIMKDCAFGVSCRRKNTGCKYLHGSGIAKFKWSSKNSAVPEKRSELTSC